MAASDIVQYPWFPKTEPRLAGGAEAGIWQGRDQQSLGTIANNLVYEVANSQVNALPSPWSRALQFQQAVLNSRYPTRTALLEELFGCLATVALWDMFGVKLEAERVFLPDLAGIEDGAVGPFARSLQSAAPDPAQALYRLADGSHPWHQLYVLRLNGLVIGFSSPATLVCPAVHLGGAIPGMNWSAKGRFSSPIAYLGGPQKQALADWISQLSAGLLNASDLHSQVMASQLADVFKGFVAELSGGRIGPLVISEARVPNLPPKPTALALLARPAKGGVSPSQATLDLGDRRRRPLPSSPTRPVVLLDPQMPNRLGLPASEINLYKAATLESVGNSKEKLESLYGQEIEVVTPDDLFLQAIYLLAGESALLHSWLPRKLEGQPLVNGTAVTPLLPLRERVRDLFSSAELQRACSLRLVRSAGGSAIEVTLQLPLVSQAEPYPVSRSFALQEQNLIAEDLPVVSLWPNIDDSHWSRFVVFCEDSSTGLTVDGFADYQRQFGRDAGQAVKYFTTDRFPDLIKMIERGKERGLIPVEPPPPPGGQTGEWKVGIDFGTSFTNFFVDEGGGSPVLKPLDTRVIPLTLAQKETRQTLLSQYFIPEDMLPRGQNPPTATALSLRGWLEVAGAVPELFHEARLKVPTPGEFGGAELRTGFKWRQLQYQKPYLKELALLISANAAAAGASAMAWSVSYPSAFSPNEVQNYRRLWSDLCQELGSSTGLPHSLALGGGEGGLQTEAVAFASYFGNYLGRQMVHTACLDVGGGTTDLSIWEENTLTHQVSVPYAGRQICSQLLQRKPSFLKWLFPPSLTADISDDEARARQDRNFTSRLDNIMRYGSEDLLSERLPVLRGEGSAQLEQFISLLALSFGGLYHYLGTILRGLDGESRLLRSAPMPVYLGGNGGRLINWLDQSGRFSPGCEADQLMERLQQLSTGFASGPAATTLSDAYKNETACGLISTGVNLKGDFDPRDELMFSGEQLEINGQSFGPTDRVELAAMASDEALVSSYRLSNLAELKQFLINYDATIQSCRITGLQPVRKLCRLETLWSDVETEVRSLCLERQGCELAELEPEPGFILGLRALTNTLGRQWAERF